MVLMLGRLTDASSAHHLLRLFFDGVFIHYSPMTPPILESLPTPTRILIIRLSAIGDIIMASGLIPALRQQWPNAYIAWLSEDAMADTLAQNPKLDRVHRLPRATWRKMRKENDHLGLIKGLFRMARQLKEDRFDLVLDLQGLLKSGIWAWASGAPHRIGLGSREGSQLLMTRVIPRAMNDPRIGKEYRDLAIQLGAPEEAFQLDIPCSERSTDTARSLLKKHGIIAPYGLIAPFTTRLQKHWFDERWASLAQSLGDQQPLIMLGGPDDREHASAIVDQAGGHILSLVGETSLEDCAALIKGAAFLIGVDTGLSHLGIAQQTPTLALFGSTLPYAETTRGNSRVLYEPFACSPCHRHPTCGGRFDCMRHHDESLVLNALKDLLQKTKNTHA